MRGRSSRQGLQLTDKIVLQDGFQLCQTAGDQCPINHPMISNQGDQAAAVSLEGLVRQTGCAEGGVEAIARCQASQRGEAVGTQPSGPLG
jgi:hypothetical protein